MAAIPGNAGYTVIGDKTVEFYRDPQLFVNRRINQYGSKIFLSRILNKPTVFIASNAGVRELLNGMSLHNLGLNVNICHCHFIFSVF